MVDTEAVHRLLTASREAHKRKKRLAGVVDREGNVLQAPDWPSAEQEIVTALKLRLEAHALDPAHTAPAWMTDQLANKGVPDAELIKFFVAYAKPFIAPEQMAAVLARFPAYADVAYIP